ncbi:conserved exported hypothetical protein [Candidatus Terasakiella magnetica]|nr:conserved exported hypothetical protein [Candidatus Terasakiella magnetica]
MNARRMVALVLGLGLLAACNAEERAHVVKLDKGGYAGPQDGEITDTVRTALGLRIALQSEGPGRVAVVPGIGEMPEGQSPITGRIAGQKF